MSRARSCSRFIVAFVAVTVATSFVCKGLFRKVPNAVRETPTPRFRVVRKGAFLAVGVRRRPEIGRRMVEWVMQEQASDCGV